MGLRYDVTLSYTVHGGLISSLSHQAILAELDTSYLDLILLHSPPDTEEERREAWTCLEKFYDDGKAKAIGKTYIVKLLGLGVGIAIVTQEMTIQSPSIMYFHSKGVSNYEIHHLEELAVSSSVSPQVNQILYNPLVYDSQFDLVSVTMTCPLIL